jgi:small subunit ribosomal protein S1
MNPKEVKITAVKTGAVVDIGAPMKTTLRTQGHHEKNKDRPSRPLNKREESAPEEAAPLKKVETVVRKEEPEVTRPIVHVEPLEIDESGDFAAMFAESEVSSPKNISLKMGDRVSGKVVQITKDNIFISLGPKQEAAIATVEYTDEQGHINVSLGQTLTAYVVSVHGGVGLSNRIGQAGLDEAMLQDAKEKRVPVEGKVTAINKGGFEVTIGGKKAFCPVGQIDSRFVEDTNSFVGKVLSFLVERIEEGGRNIVVSRRALLDREKKEKAIVLLQTLEVGQTHDAVVTRVTDFGAFADIGGIEGLIPRSEISHGHIDRVSDAISSNDRVSVVVLTLEKNEADPAKSRVSLSVKQTKQDPFSQYSNQIKSGATLEGRVVRLESFGAFVELFPGVDGLIHISELSENRVAHPKEILNINDPVTVRVLDVKPEEKRISLSLREEVSKKRDQAAAGAGSVVKVERGQKVKGVVSRIERYGVFLELENGANALLPQSECGLGANADISRAFKVGQPLDVAVIDIDEKNRIRVSLVAFEKMQERDSYLQFQTKENKSSSFGTFADLLKNK